MPKSVWITLTLLLAALSWADIDPIRLESGDVVAVTVVGFSTLGGQFTVLSDGTISMPRLGSVDVRGRTLEETAVLVREKASKIVRKPEVHVSLVSERPRLVYVAGEGVTTGAVDWFPGMKVREVLALVTLPTAFDAMDATLYRSGDPARIIDIASVLSGSDPAADLEVLPGDLLTLLPSRATRVWILGSVADPGEFRVGRGTTVGEAIALAGGVSSEEFQPSEITVTVRRDGSKITLTARADDPLGDTSLMSGDTVIVGVPVQRRVTVAGSVTTAGELLVSDGTTVLEAIERAGGKTETGTLSNVMVFRGGRTLVLDLTRLGRGSPELGPLVEQGDFVFVSQSKADYYVFGAVETPGRMQVPEDREIRLTDALAAAGGLIDAGTYRRVVLLRAGRDGALVPSSFNLDEFMKDGELDQNPEIRAGDVVFFQEEDGMSLNSVVRVASSLLLLDRVFR